MPHVAFEDLGLLSPILQRAGWTVSCGTPDADLTDPAIAAADLLIVLGGPIAVYHCAAYPFLELEVAILQSRMAQNRPTWASVYVTRTAPASSRPK